MNTTHASLVSEAAADVPGTHEGARKCATEHDEWIGNVRKDIIKAGISTHAGMLIAFPSEGYRSVAGTHIVVRVPLDPLVPLPGADLGDSDYLLQAPGGKFEGDKPPTMDNAMVQNWRQQPAWLSCMWQHPQLRLLFETIYGEDAYLTIERMWQQTPTASDKGLPQTAHADYPKWHKRPASELPAVTTVPIHDGEWTVIILCQAAAHGIPKRGHSRGFFVGALSAAAHAEYQTATMEYLAKCPSKSRPQHFELLGTMARDGCEYGTVVAAMLLAGARPPLHPSRKLVVMPAGYNWTRYKWFNGYFPPAQTNHVTAEVVARVPAAYRMHFAAAAAYLGPACAMDPSILDTEVLRRLGVGPIN